MQTIKLALIGFGNVGQGLVQILCERDQLFKELFQVQWRITAICDLHRGAIHDPQGFDPQSLLDAIATDGHLQKVPAPHRGWDTITTIERADADVIVEMSYTDLRSGQPALDHMRAALSAGRHVVTTNKGPIALHYAELANLAASKAVCLGLEGTVMSGSPAIGMGQQFLQAAGITKIEGILNGTTNFMLTAMAAGASYQAALAEAQAKGYAETDPSGDVEGYDAAGKAIILAQLFMATRLDMDAIDRRGITTLTAQDMAEAHASGKAWKLLASVERTAEGVSARVAPVAVSADHPLYGISGATNAITYTTEELGEVTLVGPGAGRRETGYALIEDMLTIYECKPQGLAMQMTEDLGGR